ncbi:bis-aminopropyl spermidine synthase family protein [Rhodothermus profundi]|uniref:N(4)-bis(aminopropyl)spermidine synthase n=1 Tax=Rhodothermus profundi TaxID=633813 RepID=A0A1M6RYC0_9BACT|nr:bis-aminopropyl spermidine synthase family protein [Rhodothermus profundi]SHK37297.1 hypothetical protein SAMN04488087_1002 [Rhodothermus profundi]
MTSQEAIQHLSHLLAQTRQQAPVPFTERDAKRALAALLTTDNLWEAIRLSHVPLRALTAFWHQLIAAELLEARDGALRLTKSGQALAQALGVAPAREATCPHCEGRGVDYHTLPEQVVTRFAEICKQRPEAIQAYDQGFVTEATTLSRIAFAWHRGDLEGKTIIVLGDDDLMSIAAALTGAPARILAIDIDERLIQFINEVARREGLDRLEAVRYDLRDPLPTSWLRSFDTFMTDPTESFLGFKTTIERGLMALRGPGCAGYFGLTHVESSYEKWARIQRFLLDSGAVLTDLLDDFSAYINWGYIESMRSWKWLPTHRPPERSWYYSALHRIELLRTPALENTAVEGDIFSDEEAATT